MSTELQEQFKNYVFENVKENLDEWNSIGYDVYWATEKYRKFKDKIIGLRRQYAKEKGLKTVTQICPKPSDLMDTVMKFMREYITSETARILAEYKPLAIDKVLNDEELIKNLNTALVERFSEYKFYGSYGNRTLFDSYGELRDFIQEYYDEIKHTLSNPAECVCPCFDRLANEILKSLFTLQLVLKTNNSEEFKNVA